MLKLKVNLIELYASINNNPNISNLKIGDLVICVCTSHQYEEYITYINDNNIITSYDGNYSIIPYDKLLYHDSNIIYYNHSPRYHLINKYNRYIYVYL